MEALHTFAERYRDLFEILGDAVVVSSLDGNMVASNDAMAALTGYTVGELRDMNIARLLSEEDREQVAERQQQQINGEAVSQRYDLRIIRKDGTRVIAELVTKLLSEKGRPAGVLTILKNVTEQKRAQMALLEERDKAQSYLDVAGVAIQVIDTNQRIMQINRKSCEVLGYSEKEALGKSWFDTFTPERNRSKAKALFQKLLAGEIEPGKCHESPVVTKSGEERILAWYNTTLVRDEAGNVVGALGSGEDITERKLIEKALRDSEERYRTLFEDSRDAICIISSEGNIVDVNQAALELFGYDRGEMMQLNTTSASVNPAEAEGFQQEIEEKGYVRDFEMKLRRKDGSEIDCLLTFTRRRGADGNLPGYEGSIRDITEHKRLQQNLRLYVTEVTKAQEEERKRIARELHDETIQELAILSLDIEAVVRGAKQLSGGDVKSLASIQAKVNHIGEELSRLSHALRPNVLDQLGLVPAVKVLVRDLKKHNRIQTDLAVVGQERRLSPEVELGLFRVVQEAVRNVRKHSDASAASVTIEFNGGDDVMVAVTDNGKGFQLPKTISDFAAMGRLGLVGMEERALLFGGNFWVESELGKGTTVRVHVGNHV